MHDFNPLKPRRGVAWTETSLVEALQRIGGEDALVAWDRDVTQALVLNRTWATTCENGGRVWLSKTARRPLPIVDAQRVWTYARPTEAAPIGYWSSTTYLNSLFDQVVFDVGVPTRARSPFQDNKILFVGDLVRQSPARLLAMSNLGKTTLQGIQRSLAKHGLSLRMNVGSWVPSPTSLTWPEPAPGPYDVTFDCEVFNYVRPYGWHPIQYRIIRPPDSVNYASACRYDNYVSDWYTLASWAGLLSYLNIRPLRNVRVVEAEALPG
jgi:hypothetical protein